MRGYLLDTHIWMWFAAGSPDLPMNLRDVLEDATGRCWLSPISLWEIGMLTQKGRIRGRRNDWIRQSLAGMPMREASLNFEVAMCVETLSLPHGDPADHLIAATALVHELTLVTMDQKLVDAPWLSTLTR